MNFFQSLSSKIKYKRIRLTKQGWIHQSPNPIAEVTQEPVTFFEQLTEAQRAVLNYFLVWSNSYNSLYFSQSTIAQDLGYSRGFVNRTLAIFEATGLISSNYRHKTSSLYKVSKWFKDIKVRESLSPLFKAFIWFPLALLSATQAPPFTGSVTQEVKYLYNNINLIDPKKNIIDNMYRPAVKIDEESFKKGKVELKDMHNKHLPADIPWEEERKEAFRPRGPQPISRNHGDSLARLEQQEKNDNHLRGLRFKREEESLLYMTQAEADLKVSKMIDADPCFGSIIAEGWMKNYKKKQMQKQQDLII